MNHYRVVYIRGLGYGYITPGDWATYSVQRRNRVRVMATFGTELEAQRAYSALPPDWVDIPGLHYWGGEWWRSTGIVTIHTGQKMKLNMPVDHPALTIQHRGGLS